MKRIAWLTDVHLNFLSAPQVDEFLLSVAAQQPDAVLIGGDIGEAPNVCGYLVQIARNIPCPVYFVLGNHDYYHGSIVEVRHLVRQFCAAHERLHYLTALEVEALTPHVGLVGHDGWADGRAGDFFRSGVSLWDYKLIAELTGLDAEERLSALNQLGDEAAEHFRRVLPLAFERYAEVVLLTHVPPLREACWYDGRLSDDQWAPHFTCQAVGTALLEIMATHPDKKLTVLCGHTHGAGEAQPLPNLQIFTGAAEYGHPAVQRVFEFE